MFALITNELKAEMDAVATQEAVLSTSHRAYEADVADFCAVARARVADYLPASPKPSCYMSPSSPLA